MKESLSSTLIDEINSSVKGYLNLSEVEKIPSRIKAATEIALVELYNGVNLYEVLDMCIKNEQYCGAEGIKKALLIYNTCSPKQIDKIIQAIKNNN